MRLATRFVAARFVGWLACLLPTALDLRAGRLSGWSAVGWFAGFLGFGIAYFAYFRLAAAKPRRVGALLIVIQSLSAVAMVWTAVGLTKYLSGVTFTIVAGHLPYTFSVRTTWILVAIQSAVLAAIFANHFGLLAAMSAGGAFAAFFVFAIGQTLLERELDASHAKLRATTELLVENSRIAERLRIARDLHDSIGHHLTALSIQLDVASRQLDGSAAEPVLEAHAITRLLLSDLRNAVSELREQGRMDVAAAIRSLTSPAHGPRTEIDMPQTLYVVDSTRANALLRSVQEILTNASRHGGARHVWIQLLPDEDGIHLRARDDGAGAATITLGNGLRGMRERFEAHEGWVTFASGPGLGFEVRGFMPQRQSSS